MLDLDLFQVLARTVMNDGCGGLKPIVAIIKAALNVVCIIIPILLIVFCTIDLGKAVISSDEKEVKKAQGTLIKRAIYAIIIFLVPYLVSWIMSLVDVGVGQADIEGDTNTWSTCWESIGKFGK